MSIFHKNASMGGRSNNVSDEYNLFTKYCPLLQRDCLGSHCAWYTEYHEITGDGVVTERLCAIVEMSRGAEIAIDVGD